MMNKLKSGAWLSIVLWLCACSSAPQGNSLYQALGEQAGITKITHQMIVNFAQDERIKARFKGVNMQKFKAGFALYVCAQVGGPCEYQGDSMQIIHAGYNYTNTEFNAVVDNLILAMEQCGIPVAVQNQLLAKLAPSYKDVVYL
jgi:hemoglobin